MNHQPGTQNVELRTQKSEVRDEEPLFDSSGELIRMTLGDYVYLHDLALKYPNLETVLNRNGAANLTVCPICRVDDFTHVEGCPLQVARL